MANVFVEARTKGRPEKDPIDDFAVEVHADHVLGTFKTQREAIAWAKSRGNAGSGVTLWGRWPSAAGPDRQEGRSALRPERLPTSRLRLPVADQDEAAELLARQEASRGAYPPAS
jgi:hypothetical protein